MANDPTRASVEVENDVVKFYFASGKIDTAAGGNQALTEVAAAVKAGKNAVVSGFVDSTGDAAQNAEIAKQRAMAVQNLLRSAGGTSKWSCESPTTSTPAPALRPGGSRFR